MIAIENLTKCYGPITAIKDVTFTVKRGEVLGLIGPNGAGKSTIMKLIASFIPPTSGNVRINDYDTVNDSLNARRCIGYLPEDTPLYSKMKVASFLSFVAAAKGVNKENIQAQVKGTIDDLGLASVRSKVIEDLPRGYRQRVGIAQALIGDPPVLVLDEPTRGLDLINGREIRQLIKDLSGWKTMIISSHNLSEVLYLCDRVAVMNKGRIVTVDTPVNLASRSEDHSSITVKVGEKAHEALKVICGLNGVLSILILNSTVLKVDVFSELDMRPILARALIHAGIPLQEMILNETNLEDIFMKILKEGVE